MCLLDGTSCSLALVEVPVTPTQAPMTGKSQHTYILRQSLSLAESEPHDWDQQNKNPAATRTVSLLSCITCYPTCVPGSTGYRVPA
jgi:hypothetical protein